LVADQSAPWILSLIPKIVDRAIGETCISREELLGLGLAVPGPLDIEGGCLLNVPNLSDWANHPFVVNWKKS
jgi:hypothetical protein